MADVCIIARAKETPVDSLFNVHVSRIHTLAGSTESWTLHGVAGSRFVALARATRVPLRLPTGVDAAGSPSSSSSDLQEMQRCAVDAFLLDLSNRANAAPPSGSEAGATRHRATREEFLRFCCVDSSTNTRVVSFDQFLTGRVCPPEHTLAELAATEGFSDEESDGDESESDIAEQSFDSFDHDVFMHTTSAPRDGHMATRVMATVVAVDEDRIHDATAGVCSSADEATAGVAVAVGAPQPEACAASGTSTATTPSPAHVNPNPSTVEDEGVYDDGVLVDAGEGTVETEAAKKSEAEAEANPFGDAEFVTKQMYMDAGASGHVAATSPSTTGAKEEEESASFDEPPSQRGHRRSRSGDSAGSWVLVD